MDSAIAKNLDDISKQFTSIRRLLFLCQDHNTTQEQNNAIEAADKALNELETGVVHELRKAFEK